MTRLLLLLLLLPSPSLALVIDLPQSPHYDEWAGAYATGATMVLDYYGLVSDPLATMYRIQEAMAVNPVMRSDAQWIGPEMVAIAAEQGVSASFYSLPYHQLPPELIRAELDEGRPVFTIMDLGPGTLLEFYGGVIKGYSGNLFALDWGFGETWWYDWDTYHLGIMGGLGGAGFHDAWFYTINQTEAAPVPEPSTLLLLMVGISCVLVRSAKQWSGPVSP
jgi:hypothetical protein